MNYRITWLNYKGATATVQAGNSSTHHNAARTHRYPVNERVLQMAEAESAPARPSTDCASEADSAWAR